MKGKLTKIDNEWMVKYTTYKTIPGIKGVMGSHSRMPESNYLPVHPDTKLYPDGLWGQANVGEFETIDFEKVQEESGVYNDYKVTWYAKLINKEKSTKRSKQKKYTNVMSENSIKRMYSEDEVIKLMGMATRWDTFKEGDVEYSMDMDEFFKYLLNK